MPGQVLPQWRRAVLKIGSNLLTGDGGGFPLRYPEVVHRDGLASVIKMEATA